MNCPICKGTLKEGITELTFKRNRKLIVIEDVPALLCMNCGEAVVKSEIAKKASGIAEKEIERGVALEFCSFAA